VQRLTKYVDGVAVENHDNDATQEQCRNGYRWRNSSEECLTKLAAYEDTGLTPEEIFEIKTAYDQVFKA